MNPKSKLILAMMRLWQGNSKVIVRQCNGNVIGPGTLRVLHRIFPM